MINIYSWQFKYW